MYVDEMFTSTNVPKIDLSGMNMSAVKSLSDMFLSTKAEEIIGLNELDLRNVTNMKSMFESTSGLNTLDMNVKFTPTKTVNMDRMFYGTNSEVIILPENGLKPSSMTGTFEGTKALSRVENMDALDTSECKTFAYLFSRSGIEEVDVTNFVYTNNPSRWKMFGETTRLKELDMGRSQQIYSDSLRYGIVEGAKALEVIRIDGINGSIDLSSLTTLREFTVGENTKVIGKIASGNEYRNKHSWYYEGDPELIYANIDFTGFSFKDTDTVGTWYAYEDKNTIKASNDSVELKIGEEVLMPKSSTSIHVSNLDMWDLNVSLAPSDSKLLLRMDSDSSFLDETPSKINDYQWCKRRQWYL